MQRTAPRYGRYVFGLAVIAAALFLAGDCWAGVIASDSAADPAYKDGWQGLNGVVEGETGEDNGGTGFLPWDFDESYWEAEKSPYPQPHFIDTKPTSFNSLGAPAFALTNGNAAFNGYTTVAVRPFAAPLKVGETFSFEIDNPVMKALEVGDSNGYIVRLLTAGGVERFGFYTSTGLNDDEWTITDNRGDETSSGFSAKAGSAGFKFAIKITGEDAYQLTITPRGEAPLVIEEKLAKPGKGAIQALELVTYGNGSGDGKGSATGERELYFNNLLIESGGAPQTVQKPGDCDQNGSLTITDPICLLRHLFQGAPVNLPCDGDDSSSGNVALMDGNADKKIDLSDVVWTLNHLFQGGPPLALGSACQPIAGCPDNNANCKP